MLIVIMNFGLSDLGIVCALGCGKEEVLKNAASSSTAGMSKSETIIKGGQTFLGEANFPLPEIENPRWNTRCNRLALSAVLQIEHSVRCAVEKYGAGRVGVVVGSSNTGMREFEEEYFYFSQKNSPKKPLACHGELGNVAEFISGYFNLSAPSYTVSTACSSSAKAFASAERMIKNNVCDAVIVGGADSICKFVVNGFSALGAISPELSNPMSANRLGINIGEGAAMFLLSRENSQIFLAGVGESSDAYHATSPDPTGEGAVLSMRNALQNAGLAPQEIDYLNLHGTGTVFNDSMEAKAVYGVFKDEVLCSSTKALTGHSLGAAGAVEAGLCWLMMSDLNKENALIEHVYDGEFDKKIAPISLVGKNMFKKVKYALSNSFAFGGSNASVILGRI